VGKVTKEVGENIMFCPECGVIAKEGSVQRDSACIVEIQRCQECGVIIEEGSVQRDSACIVETQHCPECGIDFEVKYSKSGDIEISYVSTGLKVGAG